MVASFQTGTNQVSNPTIRYKEGEEEKEEEKKKRKKKALLRRGKSHSQLTTM